MNPPLATYRLQLQPEFDFGAAREIVPYLAQLGVSHLYLSPILESAPGSTHGYDVVRPDRIDPELGGEEGLAALARTARDHGLGIVVDIVPNHMAITPANPWWWDVLENGRASQYARFFDVEWQPPEPVLIDRVLMPILGDHYGRVLEAGEIRLVRDGAAFELRYAEHRLPVAPRSLDGLLNEAARRARSDDLATLADAFGALPPSSADDRTSIRIRHRDKEVLKSFLARLLEEQPAIAEHLDGVIAETNGDVNRLDLLIGRQNYRLASWRAAERDLGYRRFFDVTSLIGIRTEDEQVFWEDHRLVLGLVRDGLVSGLRVDHPDGLRDPAQYLQRLHDAAPDAWIVVEKILEPGESLRPWPVSGTSGYDFIRRVDAMHVDPAGAEALTRAYEAFTGRQAGFREVASEGKDLAARELLGSELNRITAVALDVCEEHRRYRDYTRHDLHEALRELAVSFPVYRSYVRAAEQEVDADDRAVIAQAIADAQIRRPDLPADLFDFLRQILTLELTGERETELVMRFQQLTGAVMAKGVEDTAFYRYARLLSLNEVGGDPAGFGGSVKEFHAQNQRAGEIWPASMLAGTTHDTKRSEDTRARISVLSEMPSEWEAALHRWAYFNEKYRQADAPDRNVEYFLYQTLVGTWPIELDRLQAAMEKSIHEMKERTAWTRPDAEYDQAVREFVEGVLGNEPFVHDLETFLQRLLPAARTASLASTLLRLTAPGVPDIYQGSELWDEHLVDPDNRRPVDYEQRRRLIAEAAQMTAEQALASPADGLPKLFLLRAALAARHRHPETFMEGDYASLEANGPKADHVVAFTRANAIVAIAPRLCLTLGGRPDDWADTSITLPAGSWCDAISLSAWSGGEPVALREVLGRFPVALLEREAGA